MWPLLPFVILPIVEIALFIQVGSAIGVLPVIALVIASAFAGVTIMRRQGARAMFDVQRAMQEFRDPGQPMAHGALIMIGGVLMVIPGLLTSAVGLLLMVPAIRALILRQMGARVRVSTGGRDFTPGHGYAGPRRRDDVIDGEYSVQDDPPAPVREGLTDKSDDAPDGDGGSRRGNSGWTRH